MSKPLIYSYYEKGIPLENENKTKFKCLTCMLLGEKTKPEKKGENAGQDVFVTINGATNSNLITHLEKESHSKQYKEYLDKKKIALSEDSPSQAKKKRKLEFSSTTSSPSTPKTPNNEANSMFNNISRAKKYLPNTFLQTSRY